MALVLENISTIADDQSLIVLCKSGEYPSDLKLNKIEESYVNRCLADQEELITVNTYVRLVIIVAEKSEVPENVKYEELRKLSVRVRDILRLHKTESVIISSQDASEGSLNAFAEGLILGLYHFTRHKSLNRKEKQQFLPERIFFYGDTDLSALEYFRDALYFARDLVNEPLNHMTSEMLAERIRDFTAEAGAKVEVFGIRKIESLKMGGLLAVNRGSLDPPTFSVIEWKPKSPINEKPIVIIGKGVVFDTGGINLKPTDYIEDMKSDMAGAAAVAAVMALAGRLNLPLHLMAFIPATDNRPGVRAYVPGDIIRMYNGKSVEVLNTDAEGRLILADALSYADNFDPALVITVATLTGSAANTFGNQAIACMGNADDRLFNLLIKSGEYVYERASRLPFWDEYGELLKSDIADMKNIGGREAGAISAGKFLEKFTQSPFIHLDIAGTAILKKDDNYKIKGGTGAGVRILIEYLKRIALGEVEL